MKKYCNRLRLRAGVGADKNFSTPTPTPVKTTDSDSDSAALLSIIVEIFLKYRVGVRRTTNDQFYPMVHGPSYPTDVLSRSLIHTMPKF